MRSRGQQAVLVALAALVTSLCPRAAAAQVAVTSNQDLSFGQITPGVPRQVLPTDVLNRASLSVAGRGEFRITFLLPAVLTGPAGHTIPLSFGATDGRLELRHRVETFNPVLGHAFQLNPGFPTAEVYLGGRATPAPGTRAGTYTATIVMTIVQTGT